MPFFPPPIEPNQLMTPERNASDSGPPPDFYRKLFFSLPYFRFPLEKGSSQKSINFEKSMTDP